MTKWGACVYAGLLLLLFRVPDLGLQAKLSLVIFGLMVLFWLLEPIPQVVISMLGLAAYMCVFPDDIGLVLGGFASPILFFVLGSAIVGQAIISSGLADRVIRAILQLARYSPKRMVVQLVCFLPFTPLLLPSATSRNAVLVPMYESVLGQMRISKTANLSKLTMLVLGILNPIVSSAFLTGGTAPVIAAKMLGPFNWWQWFAMLAIPCLSVFFLGACYLFLRYPVGKTMGQAYGAYEASSTIEPAVKQRLSKSQWVMLAIMIGVDLLWLTDRWHHLNPAVPVILGTAVAFLIPGIIKWGEIKHSGLWSTFITLGLLMSFINIMQETGVLDWLVEWLNRSVPATSNPVVVGLYVIAIAVFLHLLIPSIPACLTFTLTLVIHWTQQLGLHPVMYGLMAMMVIDAGTLYPTQNTTNMIAYDSERTRPADIFQLGLVLIVAVAAVSMLIGLPLWSHANIPAVQVE
jgi:anion transporter